MSTSANVRKLLRNERKARRIDHPHATYNSTGVLACQLCHISIKAESLWNQHVHGSHHRGQLQRLRAAQASKAVAAANAAKSPPAQEATLVEPNRKKRKVDDESDEDEDEAEDVARKRTRAATGSTMSGASVASEDIPTLTDPEVAAKPAAVDETEWEAFTREMTTTPRNQAGASAPSALMAAATIAAAPISAAEIAARSREEASVQARETQETEAEFDREDAAQRLEAEFEEQDQLLDRVKRLKEKREALKRMEPVDSTAAVAVISKISERKSPTPEAADSEDDEDDDEEDEEDDWAMWPK